MITARIALAAAALLVSGAASAQATWNFANSINTAPTPDQYTLCGATANLPTAAYGNTFGCTSGGITTTASAWSTTRDTTTGATNVSGGAGFASAYLSLQGGSGFGVANRVEGLSVTAPDHSMDSVTNTTDAILLGFSSAVTLNQLTLGWYSTDSDVTIMRWTGGAGGPTMGSTNVSSMTGWTLVTSADVDAADPTSPYTLNFNGGGASSWWLISAYNSTYGGTGGGLDTNNDYVKLLSVRSAGPSVAEPGSLALAGLALGGFLIGRRRRAR